MSGVTEEMVMLRTIAAMLDHPSVYMGGPSQRNMRRAEQILAAVTPLIAAAERERCAKVAESVAPWGMDVNPRGVIAAAIRALGDAT